MLERRDGRWARLPHADLQWRMGWGKECERLCAGCAAAGRNCRWRLILVNWWLGTAFGGFGQQAAGSQPDEDACRKIVVYIAAPIASASCGPIGLAKK